MNSNNRIAATLYSLGTQGFFRNFSKNTLHKGDDDYDDYDDNNNNNNNKLQLGCPPVTVVILHVYKI